MPLNNGGRPWHPVDNPLAYRLLPSWLNAHLNHQLERLQANLQPGHERGSQLIKRFMAALPATLFVLMPLLALVLRLLYWRRPMGYLEHLVVALYSHAWLLTALLLGSLASIAAAASGIALAATAANVLSGVLWLAVPCTCGGCSAGSMVDCCCTACALPPPAVCTACWCCWPRCTRCWPA